jgi:anti-anti-sigma factor
MNDLATLAVGHDTDVVEATLTGEVDLSNAVYIGLALERSVPNTAQGMVLDLSALDYIDSAGIRMLVGLAARFDWRRQRLGLVLPEGSRVRRVLELAGVDTVLAIDPTSGSARARIDESRH